jgi:hypothetical protein
MHRRMGKSLSRCAPPSGTFSSLITGVAYASSRGSAGVTIPGRGTGLSPTRMYPIGFWHKRQILKILFTVLTDFDSWNGIGFLGIEGD